MVTTQQIYIPVNKRKLGSLLRLLISFTISTLLLASGVWINHSLFIILVSCLGIVFNIYSLPLTFFLLQKYKDRKAGITIDNTGINDHTILLPVGHIPWTDIYEIRKSGQLLIILVNNPAEYISRQSNFVKRKIMKWMFKTYGSPIIITSNELKSDFNKLPGFFTGKT